MRLFGLRSARERKWMTQQELADATGLTQSTISLLEGGVHQARFSTIRKLSRALDASPEELVGAEPAKAERTEAGR
jgi:transcriptional regulator with XRE-family HTH domain